MCVYIYILLREAFEFAAPNLWYSIIQLVVEETNTHAPIYQTFCSILALKLLGIMSRNRWWFIAFHTFTIGDVDRWCQNWLVWLAPWIHGFLIHLQCYECILTTNMITKYECGTYCVEYCQSHKTLLRIWIILCEGGEKGLSSLNIPLIQPT